MKEVYPQSVHMLTTTKLSRSKCEKLCKILLSNDIKISTLLYDKGILTPKSYYRYLFFMKNDSKLCKNIVHGASGIDERYNVVSVNTFIMTLIGKYKKFNIYGEIQENGKK